MVRPLARCALQGVYDRGTHYPHIFSSSVLKDYPYCYNRLRHEVTFMGVTQNEALTIKECLELYSAASGQLINFEMSNAVFSFKTHPAMHELISRYIGVQIADDLGQYLGLPSVLGRNKTAIFRYIEEKIRERIGMWQHKLLSRAALLAKQGWRLLIYPESMVSRLLKAKYFSNSEFLEAQIGNNPSYLWRSIIAGQEILKMGVARRIGDGADTRIWGWGWLSDDSNPYLHTPCIDELRDARVSGLLTAEGNWDTDVVRDIFVDNDVQRILATLISFIFKDSWRWIGDLRGKYTVKQGYHLLMNNERRTDEVEGFNASKKLWTLPIPPKVDILQGRSLPSVMDSILGDSDMRKAIAMAAIVDVIWLTRNEIVWRNASPAILAMHNKVHALQTAWQETFSSLVRGVTVTNAAVWNPPPRGSLKCNVDTAIFSGGVGFGAVLRDHTGRFVAAKSGRIEDTQDPFMVEAIAAKEALT
ncbi:PREDICTED: uncharacterized protein LOC109177143 [Ipomoea nil]|uniref:uncharacterized protein LOC109177143 n=1 Tax=Ipomoea nil TaxID=35883 RepID=UPI000901F29F|nr:PREDICTED: uncharacterized protein LOC109177143 [Ipomoea nil]